MAAERVAGCLRWSVAVVGLPRVVRICPAPLLYCLIRCTAIVLPHPLHRYCTPSPAAPLLHCLICCTAIVLPHPLHRYYTASPAVPLLYCLARCTAIVLPHPLHRYCTASPAAPLLYCLTHCPASAAAAPVSMGRQERKDLHCAAVALPYPLPCCCCIGLPRATRSVGLCAGLLLHCLTRCPAAAAAVAAAAQVCQEP